MGDRKAFIQDNLVNIRNVQVGLYNIIISLTKIDNVVNC